MSDDSGPLHYCAETALLRGDRDRALELLEQAVTAGWREYYIRQHDPYWAALENDPRYRALMARVKADVDRQAVEIARSMRRRTWSQRSTRRSPNGAVARNRTREDPRLHRRRAVLLRVGIENATDEDPPIFPSYSQSNTDPSQYDVLGRRYYVSLNYSFCSPRRRRRRPGRAPTRFFDHECLRVECAPNPFEAKVLPMCPE